MYIIYTYIYYLRFIIQNILTVKKSAVIFSKKHTKLKRVSPYGTIAARLIFAEILLVEVIKFYLQIKAISLIMFFFYISHVFHFNFFLFFSFFIVHLFLVTCYINILY